MVDVDEVIKPELKRLWVNSGLCNAIQMCSDLPDEQEDLEKERDLEVQAEGERDEYKAKIAILTHELDYSAHISIVLAEKLVDCRKKLLKSQEEQRQAREAAATIDERMLRKRLQLRQSRTMAFQTGKACEAWKHSAKTLAQLIPEDHRLCVICLDGVDDTARFVDLKCIRCTCVMHARCFRFKDNHPDCPQCRGKFFPAPLSSYVASSMASM